MVASLMLPFCSTIHKSYEAAMKIGHYFLLVSSESFRTYVTCNYAVVTWQGFKVFDEVPPRLKENDCRIVQHHTSNHP